LVGAEGDHAQTLAFVSITLLAQSVLGVWRRPFAPAP
jgi:hypothetical protein